MQKLTESLHEMREAVSKQLNNLYNVVSYRNSNIIVAKRARLIEQKEESQKKLQKDTPDDKTGNLDSDQIIRNRSRKLILVHPALHDYGKISINEQMLHTMQSPSRATINQARNGY